MMEKGYVLIVTHGRSGSTLLQGILNSIDGCLVAGENQNFLVGQFESYLRVKSVVDRVASPNEDQPTNPWFMRSNFNEQRYLELSSELAKKVLFEEEISSDRYTRLGFKEIRYFDLLLEGRTVEYLTAYIDFLRAIFDPCIVINLARPSNRVIQSSWWKFHPDKQKLIKCLHQFESWMSRYQKEYPDTVYNIDHRDLVVGSQKLKGLFAFLQEPYSEVEMKHVLGIRHSYIC